MLFCTPEYLLFLALMLAALALARGRARLQQLILLLGSYFFYGFWDARFLLLLWLSTAIDFVLGIAIEDRPAQKRRWVTLSVLLNLAILGFFKYANFFQESMAQLLLAFELRYDPVLLHVLLPLGISFYTFQSMAYTIDVARGRQAACRDLLQFALFICFFPQLVAGPIERARELLPQLKGPFRIEPRNLIDGLALIVWGFLKKALIADTLAYALVDPFYQAPGNATEVLIAAFAFTLQVFCDFSGYVDIGRGSALILGVRLRENFRAPFFSPNIAQFWNRWHITLSEWFRDYVFIPLGGSRVSLLRTNVNIAITMILCGFWHGAELKFLIWGAYYAFIQLLHRQLFLRGNEQKRIWRKDLGILLQLTKISCTFLVVVFGSWIFRLTSYEQAVRMMSVFIEFDFYTPGRELIAKLAMLFIAGLVVLLDHCLKLRESRLAWESWPPAVRLSAGFAAGLLLALILSFGSVFDSQKFIYFQF